MQQEIIKEIKDFPGYYVSNLGKVYSTKCGKDLVPLKPGGNGHGYLKVILCKDSKMFEKRIHRLVAEAFIPNPKNLSEVNHLDEDKTNNTIDNLEWSSKKDNIRYSRCKPVIDLTTGAIYSSAIDASRALNVVETAIAKSINYHNGKYKSHKFMYLTKATDESVNTIEIFSKKFEIPEIFDAQDFVKLFEID